VNNFSYTLPLLTSGIWSTLVVQLIFDIVLLTESSEVQYIWYSHLYRFLPRIISTIKNS